MSEVEKMYVNAGVNKSCRTNIKFDDCIYSPSDCGSYNYPDFTAEKQLELIKWLAKRDYGDYTSSLLINFKDDIAYFSAGAKPKYYAIEVLYGSNWCADFENALANLINNLWQDLTEQERTEIAEILK